MTINCKGELIDLTVPKVMGILNLTPDSFFDGGKYKDGPSILKRVEEMLREGANFIDIGAYSSRPGAEHVPEDEELKRIIPIVDLILEHFPKTLISIDTFRSKVASVSIDHGAAMINDIAAGNLDPEMLPTVAKHQVPYIMMHMKGTPQSMQKEASYNDLVKDLRMYFSQKVQQATSLKINDIIIDPGFGFAKTTGQNYTLLSHLDQFQTFGLPILIGLSRKSMIYKVLESTPQEALNGTTALHTIALLKGANIIRAHDVKEAVECIKLVEALKANAL
ncbi:dihydropteroate synthase [Flagellimonas taeanensis]|uniref:dihydropteroate synthase n=1 Tax=Flavobacteriaceae TaxID=49546 RepID=UPI000E679BD7|nr:MULTISPECIES: dihydropteroate synthase [Allomuricauda]MDC6386469.1 dihydropteroate synthase [Muricauda sp. SK9]MEE1963027.1 dihydropteroate synthase [Allomuricauda taeanensis]RIV52053.1 dihydropteroate synthase [Allomuricauda taeanensis]